MAEIARVVRPGGRLVMERLAIGDLRHGQGRPVDGDPEARALADGRTTHFTTPEALAQELDALGWTEVRVERHARQTRFDGVMRTRASVVATARRGR